MTAAIQAEDLGVALAEMVAVLNGPLPRPALEQCADHMRGDFEANYDAGGNEETIWPPHAPKTVALYGPHPLLILSGRMKQATIEKGAEGNLEQIGDREMAVGVKGDIVYAATQNYGDLRRNIPQREFLVPRRDGLEACEDTLGDALLPLLEGV